MIIHLTSRQYDELLEIWEAAVRSSHDFLTGEDIQYYKPLVREIYFPAVQLYGIRNGNGKISAFMGISPTVIEMLFVHPAEQGKGYGKQLIRYAVHEKNILLVDVNEQNLKALRFYLNNQFRIIGRDPVDAEGKPFPILHLKYISSRILHEQQTIGQMIRLYCRKKEKNDELCPTCRELLDYAHKRLARCPFGENKPTCKNCTIHCYAPKYRQRMQETMRFAGPRMLLYHPAAAILHLIRERRRKQKP